MVARPKPIPYRLPNAPSTYDVGYFNQLVRQIEKVLNNNDQPELAKADALYLDLNTLPSSGYGLRPGFVFRDGSFLKIVLEGSVYMPSLKITVSRGTITVTTT